MGSKTYDEIMREITSGLTGDPKKDIPYLKSQSEMYKDHELSEEILRGCGRLLYEALPEDSKEGIGRALQNDTSGMEATLEEIRFNIYKKDLDKAFNLMEGLIKEIEAVPMFEDDSVSEYHTFSEPFEETLYKHMSKTGKVSRQAPISYSDIYYQYGSLLFEMKRYEDARSALQKAIRWNPTNAAIAFEHAETYKVMGDLDKAEALTKEIFRIAFRPADLARCYRNLGYIYIEREMIREAIACYYISMQYDPDSTNTQSELYYIEQHFNVSVESPSFEEVKEIAERCDLPIGADDVVLGIAYTMGKQALDDKKYDIAEYMLQIVYDLTEDEDVAKLIEFIPRVDEKLH